MFKLPDLPYDYGALAGWLSAETMRAHHDHHHQTYADKLNATIGDMSDDERGQFAKRPLAYWLGHLDEVPAKYRSAIRNSGGGYHNHAMFWPMLAPQNSDRPSGELLAAIETKYGSYDEFKRQFGAAAANLFGSGWVWLLADMSIVALPNQDYPTGATPILALDVWEHAYYLDYKWSRADYIQGFWEYINWSHVEQLYRQAV